ncbi:hypothetical protein SAMN04487995_5870 [Dyadobacter koreensis]|uniref:Uncharacterized protein n=1 Tax=Dyadobacter koreensis TaxID=408657 RepID=A0A1H7AR40_9BACT|nr:hypothetical protein SAMN04487995_5870 [Dyadobacter koreensis]
MSQISGKGLDAKSFESSYSYVPGTSKIKSYSCIKEAIFQLKRC